MPQTSEATYLSVIVLGLSLILISCGTSSRMQNPDPKEPPDIDFPDADAPGEKIEEGVASWYGPDFHGKLTANGEEYDMNQLTAAHRTLPFNSIVKVQNLANGRSVMVRINDRGPFAKNRIIDLSKKAATEIAMIGTGTANVTLTLMNDRLKNSDTSDLKVATFTVQLGSFMDEAKAFEHSRKIHGSRVVSVQRPSHTFYRVYYGTYIDKDKARDKMQELRKKGFSGYVKQIQN